MGVRLYPQTSNVANLEKLAGVPAGTNDLLVSLKSKFDNSSYNEAFYEALFGNGNEELNKLHNFLLYGWGKFYRIPAMKNMDYNCGELTDPVLIQQLFDSNFIDADVNLCGGVCWN